MKSFFSLPERHQGLACQLSDEETELAPSHMAGKWQSWTRTQTPNPMLFLLYGV
jgi:hypothetical protein